MGDAVVVVHGLPVDPLDDAEDGVLPAGSLRPFERRRRPVVERVIGLQRRGARLLAWWLDYGGTSRRWYCASRRPWG